MGSRIIRYVRDGLTDRRSKTTLIAPFPTCGDIMNQRALEVRSSLIREGSPSYRMGCTPLSTSSTCTPLPRPRYATDLRAFEVESYVAKTADMVRLVTCAV